MAGKLEISRRDFLNGCALSLAAGTSLSPLEILARERGSRYYPPALTGMRGSHPGSFEVAHALAWAGAKFDRPKTQTDRTYDLVVVGGGISGLAAAFLYRQRAGTDQRVLVLDNHDDFGGHAKRNEFDVDGKKLIGYGGSQAIDTPSSYSPVSAELLRDVGIHVERFYDYFDDEYFTRRNMQPSIHFSAADYGSDRTLPSVLGNYRGDPDPEMFGEIIERYPLSEASKAALLRLLTDERDYLAGRSNEEKLALLRNTSFTQYLREYVGMTEEVALFIRDEVKGWWSVSWDSLPASVAWDIGMPGTRGLGIEPDQYVSRESHDDPYIFHFPDGNASIARALVRDLVPQSIDAPTMEALVTARLDYSVLDDPSNDCRIRLNATAVDVRHTADNRHVDITYVRNGKVERVRTRHAILACYNAIVPHICPEVPEAQAEAIGYAEKVPLVAVSVAARNWRAWSELGTQNIYVPQSRYMHTIEMGLPVSIGEHRYPQHPDSPTMIYGWVVPDEPGKGLTEKEQCVAGRRRLYEMSFDEHETKIVSQLDGALGSGGFDAERDIAAITVNRWPHGYAYEYNPLDEPIEYSRWNGPHIAGRAQIGRISIANSDAAAYAYVDGAIDAADRAVSEQLWKA